MSLGGTLTEAASGLSDVVAAAQPDGSIRWTRRDQPFATLSQDGSTVEFALDPAVGAAATRTPDVVASGLGPGWVRFSPGVLDDHSRDRAEAWFASAYRRASLR